MFWNKLASSGLFRSPPYSRDEQCDLSNASEGTCCPISKTVRINIACVIVYFAMQLLFPIHFKWVYLSSIMLTNANGYHMPTRIHLPKANQYFNRINLQFSNNNKKRETQKRSCSCKMKWCNLVKLAIFVCSITIFWCFFASYNSKCCILHHCHCNCVEFTLSQIGIIFFSIFPTVKRWQLEIWTFDWNASIDALCSFGQTKSPTAVWIAHIECDVSYSFH